MNRNEIIEVLKNNVVDVYFTKVNGEERTLRCTLNSDVVPSFENKKERKINESVLPVWDLEKSAWRSFRIDSVRNIQTVMFYG